jgi:hypothetical protein
MTVDLKPYQRLVRHWKALGLTIPAGVSDEALREFELQSGLAMPLEFREYFLNVNGMAQIGGQDCDENGFAFWPFDRIRPIHEECESNKVPLPAIEEIQSYFAFSDYMQWSWAYAISFAPGQMGNVLQFGTRCPRIVARSFGEFVDAYLKDSEQLYLLGDHGA